MTVRVYPGAKNPTHEISLSDGVRKWGLRLDGGPAAITEVPMVASTLQFSGGGTKFGDWEPGMSHIEQRTWEGGRGQEDYVDDPTRYFDAQDAWTITPGKVLPVPQWRFAEGLRDAYAHLPGNMDWQPLIGDFSHLSMSFLVGSTAFEIDQASLWLRRQGSPADLSLALYTDHDGAPGEPINGSLTTIDLTDVPDLISQFVGFDLAASGSLSANTRYHLVVFGHEHDSAANHWEVGIDRAGNLSLASSDGLDWAACGGSMYFRVTDVAITRKWHLFLYRQALYAVDQRSDGVTSRLYLNGDRGKASQGTSMSLTDQNKTWQAGEWTGAWVCISNGKGIGQRTEITGNTNNTLFVKGWDIPPENTSEYVIYQTSKWRDISPKTGNLIDGVVTCVSAVGEEVLLAQGLGIYILRMRWNAEASPPAHEFADDGNNKADLLFPHVDAVNGVHIWRVKREKSRIGKAAIPLWGTPYSYETDIDVGDGNAAINNLLAHNGRLFAFKSDGRYLVNPNGSVEKSLGLLNFYPTYNNGEAILSQGLFVYFSWGGYALKRLYDSGYSTELTEVGPGTNGGLPDGRCGKVSALAAHPAGIFAAVNAGPNGVSSLLARPDGSYGWHEVFRGWEKGCEINNLLWQQVGEHRPRLWISAGGELVYQDYPVGGFEPCMDTGMRYQHEAVLVGSIVDMGSARLPKFIKELSVLTQNLADGVKIQLDYQTDAEAGSQDWNYAGSYHRSPEDCLPILRGDVRRIRLRLRLQTNDCTIPPVLAATVLEGYARTPLKYQWNLRVKVGDCQADLNGNPDHDPDAFLAWLKDAARQARAIRVRSIWEQLDGKIVVVEPPTLLRTFTNNLLGLWGGAINLTLRES